MTISRILHPQRKRNHDRGHPVKPLRFPFVRRPPDRSQCRNRQNLYDRGPVCAADPRPFPRQFDAGAPVIAAGHPGGHLYRGGDPGTPGTHPRPPEPGGALFSQASRRSGRIPESRARGFSRNRLAGPRPRPRTGRQLDGRSGNLYHPRLVQQNAATACIPQRQPVPPGSEYRRYGTAA